jgi:hypothetical protein
MNSRNSWGFPVHCTANAQYCQCEYTYRHQQFYQLSHFSSFIADVQLRSDVLECLTGLEEQPTALPFSTAQGGAAKVTTAIRLRATAVKRG